MDERKPVMAERKEYRAPEIRTEEIEVGVFGQYDGPALPTIGTQCFNPILAPVPCVLG